MQSTTTSAPHHDRVRVRLVERGRVRVDHARGLISAELDRRVLGLRRADVGGEVQRLAVQVGELDDVAVDDPELADAGGGEIGRDRAAEGARRR